MLAAWVERGWPLIARRMAPGDEMGDAAGVPLGLPLPPAQGKRRLAFVVPAEAIVSTSPPPTMEAAMEAAPASWRPTMDRLVGIAAACGGEARLYGSLAWRLLTGLDYLTARSDLDMLLPLPARHDVRCLTDTIAALERAAPMNLDGELVRSDGAGVNWRELHEGAAQVLVKTAGEAVLLDTADFLGQ
jgi:phosphoribosyl-dephospho-CoA transferase